MESRSRTRGGSRGRGRSVRTRGDRGAGCGSGAGRGRGRGGASQRPSALYRKSVQQTSNTTVGTPLKRQKQAQRSVTWSPYLDQPGTSGMPNPSTPTESNLLSDSSSCVETPYMEESQADSSVPVSLMWMTDLPLGTPLEAPKHNKRKRRTCSPSVVGLDARKRKINLKKVVNYGSESDDTSDDDESCWIVAPMRKYEIAADTPLDEPEDSNTNILNETDIHNETNIQYETDIQDVTDIQNETDIQDVTDIQNETDIQYVTDIHNETDIQYVTDIQDVTDIHNETDIQYETDIQDVTNIQNETDIQYVTDIQNETDIQYVTDIQNETDIQYVTDTKDVTETQDVTDIQDEIDIQYITDKQDVTDIQNEIDTISTASYFPRDMYDFQWTEFPDPPIRPQLRRETFSSRMKMNVGPTSNFSDSYEAFTAIWNHEIMQHIAKETNRYAQRAAQFLIDQNKMTPQSRICDWRDTTVQELYVFFAIILAMGVVVKTKMTEYWSASNDIFSTPGFRAYMTSHRFELLWKCLHFNNNENLDPSQMDRAQAKLFKIQPVVTHLNDKFQSLYILNQNLALDESLLPWKGYLNINQHIPNKKGKIGIKSYEICESTTGYLWRFEIQSRKQPIDPELVADHPTCATIPSTVLRLVQGLENKGYTLWMDNYFNSPALARKLKSIGFDCVGTLRTNRKFVPENLNKLTKSQMLEGQIVGVTSGDVDLLVWRDKNLVAMISTYHGNAVNNVNNTHKPIAVSDYNIMMRGVDIKDQMLSAYPIERKYTKMWYKKLFRRLLNVSVLNAYVIMKHSNPKILHRDFRIGLINSILEKNYVREHHISPLVPTRFEAKNHYLAEYRLLPGKTERLRRRCKICKKRVATYCAGCDKAVCIRECFVALHQ